MKFFARILAIAIFAAGALAPAAVAQEWSLEVEGDIVRLRVPPDAEVPSTDEVHARLLSALGFPTVASQASRGDVLLTAAAAYGPTWRLQNDVTRRGGDEVLLSAGSPLHQTEYQQEEVASGRLLDETVHEQTWRVWCGPPPANDARTVELCIRTRQGQAEAARLREYNSHSTASFFPVTWPEIVEDASAAADLPVREWVFTLDRVSRSQIVVDRSIRYGDQTESMETLRIPSNTNGEFVLDLGNATVVMTPDGDGLRAELRTQANLRETAEGMVEGARSERAAQGN